MNINPDITARVQKLPAPAQYFFHALVDEGESNPAEALARIRKDIDSGKIEATDRPAAQMALVALTESAGSSKYVPLSDDEAAAGFKASIVAAEKSGDEARAQYLQGILDRLDSKKAAESERMEKVNVEVQKQNALTEAAALEQYTERFAAQRELEITAMTSKNSMTLEAAESFFEKTIRPGLERSLRTTYGLPT